MFKSNGENIEENKMKDKLRDPLPEELNTPEFNAVWDCIKHWDIGILQNIYPDGGRTYGGATENHVVAILDALRQAGCLKENKNERD